MCLQTLLYKHYIDFNLKVGGAGYIGGSRYCCRVYSIWHSTIYQATDI